MSYLPEFFPYWIKTSELDTVSKLNVIDSAVGLPSITVPGKGLLFRITGVETFDEEAAVVVGEDMGEGEEGVSVVCSVPGVEVAGCVASLGGVTLQPAISAIEMTSPIA